MSWIYFFFVIKAPIVFYIYNTYDISFTIKKKRKVEEKKVINQPVINEPLKKGKIPPLEEDKNSKKYFFG